MFGFSFRPAFHLRCAVRSFCGKSFLGTFCGSVDPIIYLTSPSSTNHLSPSQTSSFFSLQGFFFFLLLKSLRGFFHPLSFPFTLSSAAIPLCAVLFASNPSHLRMIREKEKNKEMRAFFFLHKKRKKGSLKNNSMMAMLFHVLLRLPLLRVITTTAPAGCLVSPARGLHHSKAVFRAASAAATIPSSAADSEKKLTDYDMGDFPIERIRNFSIVAHIGTGILSRSHFG